MLNCMTPLYMVKVEGLTPNQLTIGSVKKCYGKKNIGKVIFSKIITFHLFSSFVCFTRQFNYNFVIRIYGNFFRQIPEFPNYLQITYKLSSKLSCAKTFWGSSATKIPRYFCLWSYFITPTSTSAKLVFPTKLHRDSRSAWSG